MGVKKAHITVLKTEIVFIAAAIAAAAFTAGFLAGGARTAKPLEIEAVSSVKETAPAATAVPQETQAPQEIPAPEKTAALAPAKAPVLSGKTNINTADAEELSQLPGIGPAYAERIIEYRNAHDGFKTPEEIKNVSGIGEKTFLRFKDFITTD